MRVKVNRKALLIAIVDSGMDCVTIYKKSGVSNNTFFKIVNNKQQYVSPQIIYKIAQSLGVKPSSLIVVDDE